MERYEVESYYLVLFTWPVKIFYVQTFLLHETQLMLHVRTVRLLNPHLPSSGLLEIICPCWSVLRSMGDVFPLLSLNAL